MELPSSEIATAKTTNAVSATTSSNSITNNNITTTRKRARKSKTRSRSRSSPKNKVVCSCDNNIYLHKRSRERKSPTQLRTIDPDERLESEEKEKSNKPEQQEQPEREQKEKHLMLPNSTANVAEYNSDNKHKENMEEKTVSHSLSIASSANNNNNMEKEHSTDLRDEFIDVDGTTVLSGNVEEEEEKEKQEHQHCKENEEEEEEECSDGNNDNEEDEESEQEEEESQECEFVEEEHSIHDDDENNKSQEHINTKNSNNNNTNNKRKPHRNANHNANDNNINSDSNNIVVRCNKTNRKRVQVVRDSHHHSRSRARHTNKEDKKMPSVQNEEENDNENKIINEKNDENVAVPTTSTTINVSNSNDNNVIIDDDEDDSDDESNSSNTNSISKHKNDTKKHKVRCTTHVDISPSKQRSTRNTNQQNTNNCNNIKDDTNNIVSTSVNQTNNNANANTNGGVNTCQTNNNNNNSYSYSNSSTSSTSYSSGNPANNTNLTSSSNYSLGAASGTGTTGNMENTNVSNTNNNYKKYKQPTLAAFGVMYDSTALKKELTEKEAEVEELNNKLNVLTDELHRRQAEIEFINAQQINLSHKLSEYQHTMRQEMLKSAQLARVSARRELYNKHFDLGQIAVLPHNGKEVWVEGNTLRGIMLELKELSVRRDEIETIKKNALSTIKSLTKQDKEREDSNGLGAMSTATITTTTAAANNNNTSIVNNTTNINSSTNNSNSGMELNINDALLEAQEELQLRTAELAAVNNKITLLKDKQASLEHEKKAFLKEIRRINDEDASEFLTIPTLGENEQYVLLELLGKGGFSEVWRGFDCLAGRYVACKIHRISKEWSLQTRSHYVRHAERELAIMRQLHHPHLTTLYDVFKISESEFVSVMEFSHGMDLDTYLKRYRTMKESDARLLLLQIISALRYLAMLEEPVIHYDLKPANILLHSADPHVLEIKITDFGLSKIISERCRRDGPSSDPSIELTSQGTGTYWYLPPECFDTSSTPRISPKVDVWSLGIIFYQMLYGRRPFAEGESQRKIWQEKLIISSARSLYFPENPKVSEEAKEIIRGCLAFSVNERYDIHQLSQHPYVTRYTRRSSTRLRQQHTTTITTNTTTTTNKVMPTTQGHDTHLHNLHESNIHNNNNINVYPAPSIASNVNKSGNTTHDHNHSANVVNLSINEGDRNKSDDVNSAAAKENQHENKNHEARSNNDKREKEKINKFFNNKEYNGVFT